MKELKWIIRKQDGEQIHFRLKRGSEKVEFKRPHFGKYRAFMFYEDHEMAVHAFKHLQDTGIELPYFDHITKKWRFKNVLKSGRIKETERG